VAWRRLNQPPDGFQEQVKFHVSLIARHVEDLELALPIVAGPDGRDSSVVPGPLGRSIDVTLSDLKIAYFEDDGGSIPTPEITAAVQEAARALASAGAAVKHDRPAIVMQAGKIYHDVSRGDGGDGAKAFLNSIGTKRFSPLFEQSLAVALSPRMTSITEALFAFTRWDIFRNEMTAALSPYDAVLSPIAPFTALLHGAGFEQENVRGMGYCQVHNLTGWPAVVVRVGTSREGLPIGVQIAARPWREDVALALAKRLEDAFGGWKLARQASGPAATLVNPNCK
jgi:amidase